MASVLASVQDAVYRTTSLGRSRSHRSGSFSVIAKRRYVGSVHGFLGPFFSRSSSCRRVDRSRRLKAIAFRESGEIHDWRVKEMVTIVHKYFVDFLTEGNVNVAEDIFDDSIVHTDVCWDPIHPTVGVPGMKHYLQDLKTTFPDFWVEVDQIAVQDPTNSIWVRYEGLATGLGQYHGHKASGHTNNFTGVNMFTFNADRSKIIKVDVMRTAFSEDREELQEKVPEAGFRELRLKRLV